jgi:hypothetical protein
MSATLKSGYAQSRHQCLQRARSGHLVRPTNHRLSLCYRVLNRHSFLVVADTANLIARLRVEGSLLQRFECHLTCERKV